MTPGWLSVRVFFFASCSIRARYAIDDFRAAYTATLAGVGVLRCPRMVCGEDVARGRLRVVLDRARPAPLAMHLAYPASHRRVPAVREFVRVLDDVLRLRPFANHEEPREQPLTDRAGSS